MGPFFLRHVAECFRCIFLSFFCVGRRGGEALPLCSESEGIGFQRIVETPMIGVALGLRLQKAT